jgi:hypothetical protein
MGHEHALRLADHLPGLQRIVKLQGQDLDVPAELGVGQGDRGLLREERPEFLVVISEGVGTARVQVYRAQAVAPTTNGSDSELKTPRLTASC